jgi:hypothetical protein
MKLIKRVLSFEKHDWKHVWFLFKNMVTQFIKGDLHESKDAFMWIKIHFTYDSQKVGK